MWKPAPSRPSLRSGALLLSLLASLGACAAIDMPRRGFAEAPATRSSQPEAWGFARVAAPSQLHGYARISEPAQPAVWGYVELPVERAGAAQARR